ncbi:hypothetical protein MHH81_20550 [Psychrobacillus sp. FSL H8-0484]|uniref:hypothetical protein n=1 Tax=Psychrobacillus sp. FSL H8-0484 TaxID=2921390 RepID=UPI0030FAC3D2
MLEKYPRAKKIVDDLNYHEYLADTKWIQMTPEEAAINLAKLILVNESLISSSIPLKRMAQKQVDNDYNEIGNSLHVFAKEEGRSQVGLTNEDVTKLFAHIELGGSRYSQQSLH